MTVLNPLEVVVTRASEDDESFHIVCHCTDDRIAACGLDVTDIPYGNPDDDECPLCYLAWPDDSPTCPWGCSCDEECGPDPEEQP